MTKDARPPTAHLTVGGTHHLFPSDAVESRSLTLLKTQTFTSGVVLLRYEPA